VKPVNNLIGRKWVYIDSIYKEDGNNYDNNEDFDACFVIAVTFFNIIYLLKDGES
jgi:hypothetical protein